ncbi:MAG: ribosome-associated translation inhibitor RaiA [Arenibacter sp.]|jgi:putative sigma-54 modulation protein|uniref:Sigma 54 modulation protein / S30EA ribosomal protein n=4 Tax=Arenibacter TaxID=178469 RepID=A0A221UQ82_9FLAO|nr:MULTISPECIES: ribosome-associated translation inhibitor RaiA [Arenibacter]MDX1365847.1 ribosome-associated translation inhibitor RaiA [Arenibacter latericius]ASO03517.1 sigma 54 modulation protein / S30EA ribosomal protein [Arenibacter algicola]MBU2906166.1 ribosome-associated translation inhibitor RaiA [Arenibacter algicola]MCK0136313.1 ribosome-associated translation inhibitor RaiA [Arenibacter sp. S6351L]MCK0191297.1 ribosome-associated translation inhibitor RaiA [Arenibacter sp. F20364]|tara:strand:+ start:91678 stop:91980 length:303 start_codon:yes stop_codon:yes gene_type:complete|eukprot:TRINITY_DN2220_c0_g4_i1.p1 TRINITY_DN2220_c0_g4~~TRINITY_DN2220_c0_g4_i1.p1  ORF type:complete len:101 (-),score=17.74 TRINITY_DN2220_c0_g4_i1:101-403(-)
MKVNAQSVNFTADGKLIDFIQARLNKMELFYDKVISSDVYLKVENTSAKENKIVEIKVLVPKDKFVVKKQCKSFEEAVDTACSSLERKLVKRKEKIRLNA